MMARLIDADARIEEIKKAYCTDCESYSGIRCRACWVDDAIGLIDESTEVVAVPVVHGRWDLRPNLYKTFYPEYCCSVCGGWKHKLAFEHENMNNCPNCGARMDGETQ